MLRVDITAAKRIYQYRLRAAQAAAEGKASLAAEDVFEDVSRLFVGFSFNKHEPKSPTTKGTRTAPDQTRQYGHPGAEVNALRVLGEATAEMVTQHETNKLELGVESPWKLVTLFCRTHGLPRSLALLHGLSACLRVRGMFRARPHARFSYG